jgi:hypothetical protein
MAKRGIWLAKLGGRWVAKLVTRLLAATALLVGIETSLKNTKWPKHSSPQKMYKKE